MSRAAAKRFRFPPIPPVMNAPVIAEFLGHLLRASWQASALAVVVWLVIHALGDHLDARWRCRLWMLVIVRLAWPVSLPSPVSLFNLVGSPSILDSAGSGAESGYSLPVLLLLENPVVEWTWGLAAALLLSRVLIGAGWAVWVKWTARPIDSWDTWWLLQDCKEACNFGEPIALFESRMVKSPCVMGLLHPRLVLPRGIRSELSREELRLVFLHELAHLSRRDLALNWLLAAVEIIHWFNPLVWLVTRRLRADREEDCDARALETQPDAGRAYGEVMLKLIERAVPSSLSAAPSVAAASMLGAAEEDIGPLLHRFRAIKRFRPGNRTWVVGFCTWLAVALIGLTDAVPGRSPELAEQTVVSAAIPLRS